MTENEIKEFVAEIRRKSEIFRNSRFATTSITNVFDKPADIIEELLPYMAIGTVEEFKALKEKEERFDRNIRMFNEIGLEIRANAIDEFAERLKDVLITDYSVFDTEDIRLFVDTVEEIAEQMKAGTANE